MARPSRTIMRIIAAWVSPTTASIGAISHGAPLSSSSHEISPPSAVPSWLTMSLPSISSSPATPSLAERELGSSAPATATLITTEPAESSRRTRLASTPSRTAVAWVS